MSAEQRVVGERAAALAALTLGIPTEPVEEVRIGRTGNTLEAGGETERLLIMDAPTLSYEKGGIMHRVRAVPGDVVRLTVGEAARLDAAGATVAPDADLGEVEAQLEAGEVTDDQIKAMSRDEVLAFLGQNPDQGERVQTLELERRTKDQRKTVLEATEAAIATAEEGQRLQAEADEARLAAEADADTHGPTAQQVAESQQQNAATTGE